MENQTILYAIPVSGVLALIYAFFKASWISKQPEGTEKMSKIAGHIADGALAFLKREYKVLVIFVISVAILLGFANSGREGTIPDYRHSAFSGGSLLFGACRFFRHEGSNKSQRAHHKCRAHRARPGA